MKEIFLSASVPLPGRGKYFETADPFLIQVAVRELVMAIAGERLLVWGGHPAITPMIWAVCEDLNIAYEKSVVLYQSHFFEEQFPIENARFRNVVPVKAVGKDREASLLAMRTEMLSRPELDAAVFIGGMEGIEAEYSLFRRYHGKEQVICLGAPGGAARDLGSRLGFFEGAGIRDVDFASLFMRVFPRKGR
jgi:hypothetical protein